jgi:hypothetical protein
MTTDKRRRSIRRKSGITEVEAAPDAAEESPLDFALRVMRDENEPMALRAAMAKAAMTAMKGGRADDSAADAGVLDGTPDPYPHPSSLEIARRMAVILNRANDELRAAELAAEGWDVKLRGMPVDNTDWARIMGRLVAILGSCHSPIESLDRAGIRF